MERVEKVQVGWGESENANRVYSFIWHPRVHITRVIKMKICILMIFQQLKVVTEYKG